jgi:hypothetical protein
MRGVLNAMPQRKDEDQHRLRLSDAARNCSPPTSRRLEAVIDRLKAAAKQRLAPRRREGGGAGNRRKFTGIIFPLRLCAFA